MSGLRLDRECERLLLSRIVALPQAIKQVEPEFPTKSLLDHFAVSLARARAADLDRTQDFFVHRQRGSHLRHRRITASRCKDDKQ